jgi:hypothetical protein
MKIFRILCASVVLSIIPCSSVIGQNLLENPSFEVWVDDLPEYWSAESGVVITQETDPVFDGLYSVGMEALSSSNRGLYQDIPVTPGLMYDFSAYLHGNAAENDIGIYLGWLDGDGLSIGGAGPAYNISFGDYEYVSLQEIEAPAEAAWARCRIRAYANEIFCGYADMIEFKESGAATPTPEPSATPTQGTCLRHGDVNLDGSITAADAQLCFLIVLGLYTPTYEQECAADCNFDEQVTAADAQNIFLVVLGQDECYDPLP